MISSGVYRFLGMTMTSLVAVQSLIHPGPNLPGQVSLAMRSLGPLNTLHSLHALHPVLVEILSIGMAISPILAEVLPILPAILLILGEITAILPDIFPVGANVIPVLLVYSC